MSQNRGNMPDPKTTKSQHRGKYTNKACEECRRRRAKCDGMKPSCSRCQQWQISCQYSVVEDGRRPASKKYVHLLRQRIETLERLLEQHGVDAQEVADFNQLTSAGAVDSVAESLGAFDSTVDDLSASLKGKLALNDSLNFDQDGEMRYFGPTSGRLQFEDLSIESADDSAFPALGPDATPESLELVHPVDRITTETGFSKSSQDHFLGFYFKWEQPWFAVVDELLFRQSMDFGGRYWSLLLHYCILAVGSRYSGCESVRSEQDNPNTAGTVFFEQAKKYLPEEIEKPSLTTLQAVTIMGTFYIATGADATGWLYHGMASRLSLDMGLNLDPAGFEETNLFSHREIQLRRQIYWTLYCHDKWSSSYTGRICSMLDSQAAVGMPEVDEIPATESPAQKAFIPLQRAMIKVCLIQENIILSLWAPKPLLNTAQRPSFLKTCLLDLRSWFYDLPTELRLDRPNSVPHVYTLHMIYHTARILLAKPFIMKKDSKKASLPIGNDNDDETTRLALVTSRESAREICLVAQKYRQAFGSFEHSPISATHCTLSAALVLLRETENLNTPSHKNKLRLCLTVLGELAKVWHPARLIEHNLRRLCFAATADDVLFAERTVNLPDENVPLAPLNLGVEIPDSLDEPVSYRQMDQGISANNLDSLVPADSLPLGNEFFDILNENMWDPMW